MKTTNEQTGELSALEALVVDNPDIERLEVLLSQFNRVYSKLVRDMAY